MAPDRSSEGRRNGQGKYYADAHLAFVPKVAGLPEALPEDDHGERPCVIALDNYSVHHSQPIKDRMPILEAAGVSLFFLPPYNPEMNAIEPVCRQTKYQGLPERSHKTAESPQVAVEAALTKRAQILRESNVYLRRSA